MRTDWPIDRPTYRTTIDRSTDEPSDGRTDGRRGRQTQEHFCLVIIVLSINVYRVWFTKWATMVFINYLNNCEKRCCFRSHKHCKTLFKENMGRLKLISLYIYKDLRLKDPSSNDTRDHCQQDGNVVPSPRCGFCFEAAFKLWRLKLTIFV